MRVALVTPPTYGFPLARDMAGGLGFEGGPSVFLPPLDLAYLAGALEKTGDSVLIIDSDAEHLSEEETLLRIQAFNPDVIIGSISLPSYRRDCDFLKKVHKRSDIPVIGHTGIAHTPLLQEILQRSGASYLLRGDVEPILGNILRGMERRSTVRLDSSGLRAEESFITSDLDSIPFPSRHLLKNDRYGYELLGSPVTTMQTSRGCPYSCAYYCPYPLVQGKEWRGRTPGNVLAEMSEIVSRYGISKILFRDAVFTLDRRRVQDLCARIIKADFKVEWWCETRVDRLDHELLEQMAHAGCRGINIGVETGDENLLQKRAKPGMNFKELRRLHAEARKLGIRLHFLFMLGFPEDTRSTLFNTYSLLHELCPGSIGVTYVTPYPGTPLYEEALGQNLILTEDYEKYNGHTPVMRSRALTRDELVYAREALLRRHKLNHRRDPFGWLSGLTLDHRIKRWARP